LDENTSSWQTVRIMGMPNDEFFVCKLSIQQGIDAVMSEAKVW